MVYKPNVPQPTDTFGQSQADFLENFSQLNTLYGKDHVAWDGGAEAGKHTALRLQQQGADPAVTAAEGGLYVKLVGSNEELFYRYNSGGTQNNAVIPLTNKGAVSGSVFSSARVQWNGAAWVLIGTGINFASAAGTSGSLTVTFTNAAPSGDYITLLTGMNNGGLPGILVNPLSITAAAANVSITFGSSGVTPIIHYAVVLP